MPVSNLISLVALERLVLRRVNALKGATDALAEAAFVKAPPLVASDLSDAVFPLSYVRLECTQSVNELAAFLCRQVGNPYRKLYRVLTIIAAAGTAAPASMGPYGSVSFLDTDLSTTDAAYRIPFELAERTQDVLDLLNNPEVFGTNEIHKYCVDGGTIYSTRFPMEIETFQFDRLGVDTNGNLSPTKITELFDAWTDEANLPNEFLSLAADYTAARLAMASSAYLENSAQLYQSFVRGMADMAFTVAPTDFPVNPKGNT